MVQKAGALWSRFTDTSHTLLLWGGYEGKACLSLVTCPLVYLNWEGTQRKFCLLPFSMYSQTVFCYISTLIMREAPGEGWSTFLQSVSWWSKRGSMTRLVCLGVASLYLSTLCEEAWGVKGQASPWKGNLFMCFIFFKISELRRPQAGIMSDSKNGWFVIHTNHPNEDDFVNNVIYHLDEIIQFWMKVNMFLSHPKVDVCIIMISYASFEIGCFVQSTFGWFWADSEYVSKLIWKWSFEVI